LERSGACFVITGWSQNTYLFWLIVGALMLAVIVRHLLGGGMASHC